METVTTWADGFGRWYARVPRDHPTPVVAARDAIDAEVRARHQNDALRNGVEAAPSYYTDTTLVFRERD